MLNETPSSVNPHKNTNSSIELPHIAMSDRRETRRLPKGERCSHCGDRKYYIENGMRFCGANGHEIEVPLLQSPW